MASHFEREIAEQPDVVERLVREGRAAANAVAQRVRDARPRFVLIAARGSSDNAARYAQYLLGARHRLAVALAAPSLHTVYGTPPDLDQALVIGISQSGQSPDVVAVVRDAAAQGALTVALTNDADSPLAATAALCMSLGAGEERAVAASKTYTAQIAALAMLSAALSADAESWLELERIPDAMRATATRATDSAHALVGRLAGATRITVLGRGYGLATAYEIALKLKETCQVAALPYSSADFLHGPIAAADPGQPILLIAPSGRGAAGAGEMIDALRARGALLAVLSDVPDHLSRASVGIPLQAVPEWLSALTAIVPGQLTALALAEARGLDPDRPRGLAKVTRTT